MPNFFDYFQNILETPVFFKSLQIILAGLTLHLVYVRLARSWLGSFLRKAVERNVTSGRREKQIGVWILFFERTGGLLILVIMLITLISEWGFNVNPILTGAGILGLAVGLGSQNVMKDLIGGIFIFLEGPYSEGDKIKIAGIEGKVKKMTLRKTILFCREDNSVHVIPNGEVKTISIFKEKAEKTEHKKVLPKEKNKAKV